MITKIKEEVHRPTGWPIDWLQKADNHSSFGWAKMQSTPHSLRRSDTLPLYKLRQALASLLVKASYKISGGAMASPDHQEAGPHLYVILYTILP